MTHVVNARFFPHLEVASLPRLPVPPLKETLAKYLQWVEPLVRPSHISPHGSSTNLSTAAPSEDEARDWQRTQTAVAQFGTPEIGGVLQKQLEALAAESPTSWLEGLWDTGYLAYRVPCPIHVNPVFGFEDDPAFPPTSAGSQVARGASLIAASLRFYAQIRSNALEPDRERGADLCMCQYGRIFGSVRVPRPGRDELMTFADSRHVIIMHHGQFFWFDVLDAGGDVMGEADIRTNLQAIVDGRVTNNADGSVLPQIGLFTTMHRDAWAAQRKELIATHQLNKQSLRVIETALFVVCLDDAAPDSFDELTSLLLHADGTNRFFDKSIQIIVCRNGKAGINMEHSGMDGHTVLRYAAAIYSDSRQSRDQTRESLSLTSTPTRLQWKSSPQILQALESAAAEFAAFVRSIDMSMLIFEDFGKEFAVAHSLSPDALVQLAYQLAYFRINGRPGSTYESVQVKNFYHGRTECLRAATTEALLMCKLMLDSSSSLASRALGIRTAASAHVARAKECKQGHGVDRHLLGLLSLAKKNRDFLPGVDIPAIFTDKSYSTYTTDLMSTSNCGNDALKLFAFGPVAPSGLGLGYIIRANSLHINISSNYGAARKFKEALITSLRDLAAVLKAEASSKEAAAPRARL